MGRLVRGDQKRPSPQELLRASLQSKPTRHEMTSSGVPVTGPNINRSQRSGRFHRELTRPPEDLIPASHVLFTGGIGDFMVLESHMEPTRRANVRAISLATRAAGGIEQLISACPWMFPNLKAVSVLKFDWDKRFCFVQKSEIEAASDCPKILEDAQDWSIYCMFPLIERGVLSYHRSSLWGGIVADVARLGLPGRYIVCNPYSPNDRRNGRDYTQADWDSTIARSASTGMPVVVVNVGDDHIPDSPSIINLSDKTSLPESVEVVKGASEYVGIDSCMSVIASQGLSADKLMIKSSNSHLYNNKGVYYAPHQNINFIAESFKWTP